MYLIVASENGRVGLNAAIEILERGGSALDAVEAAARIVESNIDDHSVGTGGYPNINGEVELDASIMEGATRKAGAVAALKGYPHPISIARRILEKLPHHLLLAGEGAATFAEEHGFTKAELLTPEAAEVWRKLRAGLDQNASLTELTKAAQDPEKTFGTVNFLARDRSGLIASAVSTSGWAFKYPGRVGDSPLIGSGNYCDDRYGACGCTGIGEWSTRAGAARMVVAGIEYGLDLETSCRRVFEDLARIPLPPRQEVAMNLVALTRDGAHAGFSTAEGRNYVWASHESGGIQTTPRTVMPIAAWE